MPNTILLIDDSAIQAATRQAILQRAGYLVFTVLRPERALEQFRNQDFLSPIDLIITDHLMPVMTGAEFIQALRSFAPSVPVLVISGLAEAEDDYRELGVHFKLKPISPPVLLSTVHRLILESRQPHPPDAVSVNS